MKIPPDWRLLPFIVVIGLLIGWLVGQVAQTFAPETLERAERPTLTPR
jgi:hypothetical protein